MVRSRCQVVSQIEETKLAAIERPKRSQIARVLIVDRLLLRTSQGGIEPENEPNSRADDPQPGWVSEAAELLGYQLQELVGDWGGDRLTEYSNGI